MEMVMKYFLTAVISVVSIAMGSSPTAAQTAGTVLPIFTDYDTPPAQLDRLVAVADAVAVVRVDAIRFESRTDPRVDRAEDVTKYDMRVLEVFKPHAMLPSSQGTLTLTRRGGQHAENGRIVRSAVHGFEDFQQNGEYVLLLTWNSRTNDFDIAYGPNGSYQLLASGTVRPLGRSEVSARQQNKDRRTFLQELRTASLR
jgi:hypothetical protein